MKKNKGFTLIELLAVIVILAVVSIVAIPIVINMIEEAKKGALKDSVEGLTKAADMYYFQHMKNAEDGVQIEIVNNEQTAPQEPRLNYKGEVKNGFVLISYDGKVAVCADDGKYFASRALDSKAIITDIGSCTNEFDDELNTFVTVGSANYTGLRLNMKTYKDVKSLPNTASEGTVAVISDSKISGYYISPTAPTEPKDGLVWVVQNNDSEVFIETKTSKTGVSYVLQYEESDWNMKDAYVYNDEWTQLNNYNLEFTEWKYNATGEYKEFKAPYSGYYEIQLWGSQGGGGGGRGAYTKGDIYLNQNEKLYIYVGNDSGFNGSTTNGGGATDVRTVATSSKTTWNEAESLKSRIMVAGGGAGKAECGAGGAGGGLYGYGATCSGNGSRTGGIGTQIAGGIGAAGSAGTGGSGGFGYGGNSGSEGSSRIGGGGGGGWYGGGGAAGQSGTDPAGGGGSSYISGHEGCISIDNLGYHTGSSISYTGKYFLNTVMIDGQGYQWTDRIGSMVGSPIFDDEEHTSTGNAGTGHAKIKFLRFDSIDDDEYFVIGANSQKTWRFNYLGYYQTFIAPKAGTYQIELWGAGGSSNGAYTKGNITLKKDQILYIYVGNNGGYNGSTTNGGGATDIRLTATTAKTTFNEINSLKTRIMVAAGSGGNAECGAGGAGGGLTGYNAPCVGGGSRGATGATQVAGGVGAAGSAGTGSTGGFGYGGNSGYEGSSRINGGGGGGWYGGGSAAGQSGTDPSSGGGSSYISGHEGCIGVNEDATMKNTSSTKIEDSYSYTGFVFKNTQMIDGQGYEWTNKKGSSVINMPTQDHSSRMRGNNGNGFGLITFVK